jgi:hypothetical protein
MAPMPAPRSIPLSVASPIMDPVTAPTIDPTARSHRTMVRRAAQLAATASSLARAEQSRAECRAEQSRARTGREDAGGDDAEHPPCQAARRGAEAGGAGPLARLLLRRRAARAVPVPVRQVHPARRRRKRSRDDAALANRSVPSSA